MQRMKRSELKRLEEVAAYSAAALASRWGVVPLTGKLRDAVRYTFCRALSEARGRMDAEDRVRRTLDVVNSPAFMVLVGWDDMRTADKFALMDWVALRLTVGAAEAARVSA